MKAVLYDSKLRRELAARVTQAATMILDAVAVTLVVSRLEEDAKQPTVSTYSFTQWGRRLQLLSPEAQKAVALGHLQNAEKAYAENARHVRDTIEAALKASPPEEKPS